MCRRWAGVSVTPLEAGALSARRSFAEQPASRRAAPAARASAARACRGEDSFVMVGLGQVSTAPPTAAERLEQRGRVGEAAGLGLHEVDLGLLIRLLGAEQRRIADVAVL